jgi:hypothetical protein
MKLYTGSSWVAAYVSGAGFLALSGGTLTGTVNFVAGSAAAPGIAASGDTNTGIFFPTADTIAFAEGGVEAMRLDSAGNVGIGVSDPATYGSLAVYAGGAATSRQVIISPNSNSYNGQLSFLRLGTTAWNVGIDQADSNKFKIANSGTYSLSSGTAMTIDGSGNVGIGTSSPAASLSVTKQTTTLSGTGNAYGLYMYPTSSGLAYIDAVTATSGNTSLGFRTYNNGTYNDAVRIDSSGNVGVGTSTPNANTGTSLVLYSTNTPRFRLTNSTTGQTASDGSEISLFSTGELIIENRESAATIFYNGGSERARIDSSGTLLVGQTTNPATATMVLKVPTGSGNGINAQITSNTGTSYPFSNYNASSTYVGGISCTSSATAFPTSSDYRLKQNVTPMSGALDRISALKPVTYQWKIDDTDGEGFIAHELQEFIPQAVFGEKDAVDENGKMHPQSVDYSKIVVHLVAAIQELKAEIDALKGA